MPGTCAIKLQERYETRHALLFWFLDTIAFHADSGTYCDIEFQCKCTYYSIRRRDFTMEFTAIVNITRSVLYDVSCVCDEKQLRAWMQCNMLCHIIIMLHWRRRLCSRWLLFSTFYLLSIFSVCRFYLCNLFCCCKISCIFLPFFHSVVGPGHGNFWRGKSFYTYFLYSNIVQNQCLDVYLFHPIY